MPALSCAISINTRWMGRECALGHTRNQTQSKHEVLVYRLAVYHGHIHGTAQGGPLGLVDLYGAFHGRSAISFLELTGILEDVGVVALMGTDLEGETQGACGGKTAFRHVDSDQKRLGLF